MKFEEVTFSNPSCIFFYNINLWLKRIFRWNCSHRVQRKMKTDSGSLVVSEPWCVFLGGSYLLITGPPSVRARPQLLALNVLSHVKRWGKTHPDSCFWNHSSYNLTAQLSCFPPFGIAACFQQVSTPAVEHTQAAYSKENPFQQIHFTTVSNRLQALKFQVILLVLA